MARVPGVDLLRVKDLRAIFLLSEAKDLRNCLFSTVYEQLQRCFATLSMTDFDFFTPSQAFRKSGGRAARNAEVND